MDMLLKTYRHVVRLDPVSFGHTKVQWCSHAGLATALQMFQ